MAESIVVRITFRNDRGVTYSYVDDTYYDDEIQEGEWLAPFQNERGISQAFGLCECLAQSDDCPGAFMENHPTFVKVELV